MNYSPSTEILNKYADVLVNFALNSGKGVRKGEVVLLQVPENAKPLLVALRRAVLKAGAHTIIQFIPDNMAKEFYELANTHHLDFFPASYLRGRVDQVDHSIGILADTDPHELKDINPKKIMRRNNAFKQYKDWRDKQGRDHSPTYFEAHPEQLEVMNLEDKNQIVKYD